MDRRRWRAIGAVVAMALVTAVACAGDDADPGPDDADGAGLRIEVVSSRPEYVTGGTARVAVSITDPDVAPDEIRLTADDEDLTAVLHGDPDDADRLVGVVGDLPEGTTTLTAAAGDHQVGLDVTNHPTRGPVFSGEELALAACTTEDFGLAPSTPDDGCFAPTEVTWEYVDVDGAVRELDDPAAVPDDAEQVEVDGGQVPFVIRHETGVLNRAVYRISLLEPAPDPRGDVDLGAWNRRLVYRFGGGCGTAFTQGTNWAGDPSREVLRRGYATATATFNTFAVHCNDIVSAETASMVKEHFVVTYGEPVHTIGEGGSGGAIQQLLLAQNHPGLLDGIAPSLPFPDALSISPGVIDCRLLEAYYGTEAGAALTDEQRVAVNGHASTLSCWQWDTFFADGVDPTVGCDVDGVYDPDDNPDGWRCTFWETNVVITGRDPETGFANPGYDNVGVQYGLAALEAGALTVDEFLDLNETIGGLDIDGRPRPDRSRVDDELVTRAYATGRVLGPWGGIPDTPIILVDVYTDPFDFHDRVRAFSILDRLGEPDGGEPGVGSEGWPPTVSLWSLGGGEGSAALLTGVIGDDAAAPTFALDEWLTAARDHQAAEGGSWTDALAAGKPEAAESRCVLEDEEIVGPDANADPTCVEAMPVHAEPRMVAGAPRAGDLLKCELVPVDEAWAASDVDLTDDQLDRLVDVFPDGVCDYGRPGIGYGPPEGTWLDLTARD